MINKILIFDTIRLIFQYINIVKNKAIIALPLDEIGVDIIEIGFSILFNRDLFTIQKISNNKKNINNAILSLEHPKKNLEIDLFISTSDLHIEKQLYKNMMIF